MGAMARFPPRIRHCVECTIRRPTGTGSVSSVRVTAIAGAVQLESGERISVTGAVRGALVHRYSGPHLCHRVLEVVIVWIGVRPAAQVMVCSAVYQAHCAPDIFTM